VNAQEILRLFQAADEIIATAMRVWGSIRDVPAGTSPEAIAQLDARHADYINRIERAKRNAEPLAAGQPQTEGKDPVG
jgi:hypothetical protein